VAIAAGATARDPIPVASVDGAYQTFNIVQGFQQGRSLTRDAPPYLGLGVGSLIIAVAVPLGGSVGDVAMAASGLAVACALIAAYLLFRLQRFQPRDSLALVLFLYLVFVTSLILGSNTLTPIFTPGNSLLGVRSFLPYLTCAVLLAAARDRASLAAFHPALIGVLAGLQPFWSNDFGAPTAIALAMVHAVSVFRSRGLFAAARSFAVLLLAAVASAALLLLAVTGGRPGTFLAYNFRDFAADQFWIFGAWLQDVPWLESARVYTPSDLLRSLLPFELDRRGIGSSALRLSFPVAFALLLLRCFRSGERRLDVELLLFIGLALIGGTYAAMIGGHLETRYSLPLLPYLLVVGPSAAARLILRRRPPHAGAPSRCWTLAPGLLLAAVFLALFVRRERARSGLDLVFVPELGGRIDRAILGAVEFGRGLAAVARERKIPDDGILFSTYYSAIDAVAGAVPPTVYPSIIHALGDRGRARYLAAIEGFHGIVGTLDPDTTSWARYNMYANWLIHRALLRNFEPAARGFGHLFWRRRTGPAGAPREIACLVRSSGPRAATLELPAIGGAQPGVQLVSVEIEYDVSFPGWQWPLLGRRALLLADFKDAEIGSGLNEFGGGNLRVAPIPQDRHGWSFPVEAHPGREVRIDLRLDRRRGAALEVHRCGATLLGVSPFDGLSALPRLEDGKPLDVARALLTASLAARGGMD
jgi:hypothetical protein